MPKRRPTPQALRRAQDALDALGVPVEYRGEREATGGVSEGREMGDYQSSILDADRIAPPKRVKTGGRVAGSINKATAEIKLLARRYGPDALHALAKLGGVVMGEDGNPDGMAASEQARVGALNSILDRAYGKPTQPVIIPPKDEIDQLPTEAIMEELARLESVSAEGGVSKAVH